MRKKRIVACAYGVRNAGGVFQYACSILDVLRGLPRDEYEVVFLYNSHEWDFYCERHEIDGKFVRTGSTLFQIVRRIANLISKFVPGADWWGYLQADEICKDIFRLDPDLCIILNQRYIPIPYSSKGLAPIHDIMHRYESRFPEVGAIQEYAERDRVARNLLSRFNILVDSMVGKQQLIECYDADPSSIYILPFIPSTLLVGDSLKPQILNGSNVDPFVFYPAQFWPHKNHVGLIEALKIVHRDVAAHVVLCGSTDKQGYANIRQIIDEYGLGNYIHILDYVSDCEIKWLYENAACLVMPTFFGPTNIPPLEAFQYGCPVATSRIYGIPDQLGDAALYFDPQYPQEIADCIKALICDPHVRSKVITEGEIHSREWNVEEFKSRFKEILANILE